EAICEAVTGPNMRFVPTKTPEQQSCLTLHRTRHLFIRQQTAIINSIRAYLAEFGIVAPVGRNGVEQLLEGVANIEDTRVPSKLTEYFSRQPPGGGHEAFCFCGTGPCHVERRGQSRRHAAQSTSTATRAYLQLDGVLPRCQHRRRM